MPRRHALARKKITKHHTVQERLHLRRVKRKLGPSASRRREERRVLFTMFCGCIDAKHGLIPCTQHAVPLVEPTDEALASAQVDEIA